MPIQGLQFTILSGQEAHQSYQATGSFTVYNPNDGVAYVATDRTANALSWDYKVPSQSGGKFPGPINSYLSIFYLDQSGSGGSGQVVVYASPESVSIPYFWSIGRALQGQVTSMDVVTGTQPGNPGAGIARLWVDGAGHLHILDSTGFDRTVIDTTNWGTIPLGGDLSGTTGNGTWRTTSDLHARWLYTTDGSNGVVQATNGTLYFRSASTNYLMDSGGSLSISGPVNAIGGTLSAHTIVQQSTGGIASTGTSEGQIELQSTGGASSASKIAFHRTGIYATYFGLDTDNVFRIGGWSAGAVAYRLLLGDGYSNASGITVTGTVSGGNFTSAAAYDAGDGHYYFVHNAGIFLYWDGTYLRLSHPVVLQSAPLYFANNTGYYLNAAAPWMQIAPNTNCLGQTAHNGQTATSGAYDNLAHGNGFFAPNNNPGGVGLGQSWGTYSSVEHALQYGLPVAPIDAPTDKVKAVTGVYYEHMNFDPVDPIAPGIQARTKADGSYDTRPLYGFSAKDVYQILPELVGLGPDGEPESIDLDRMIVVLWEAFKELEQRVSAISPVA